MMITWCRFVQELRGLRTAADRLPAGIQRHIRAANHIRSPAGSWNPQQHEWQREAGIGHRHHVHDTRIRDHVRAAQFEGVNHAG